MRKPKNRREFAVIASMIESAREHSFRKVNEELVFLYYGVGKIVSEKVNTGKWGDNTVGDLAAYIQQRIPGSRSFNRRGLYRMKQFYDVYSSSDFFKPLATPLKAYFSDNKQNTIVSAVPTQLGKKRNSKKVSALPTQIDRLNVMQQKLLATMLCKVSWSNHLEIISRTKSPEEKFFYLLFCIKEKWSMRDLRRQLKTGYFERTMIRAKQKTKQLPGRKTGRKNEVIIPDHIFKDPYVFEFLDLPEGYNEKDLEQAMVKNIQKFILEIGKGFTYLGNQFRIQVGSKDYRTDLLFYNRDLQCLVLFELKMEEFEPGHIGKMNFYLESLDRDEKRPHEKDSIGVLLCKGKDTEVVEYALARNMSPAIIADYETKLIPKHLLAAKLHQLIAQFARKR